MSGEGGGVPVCQVYTGKYPTPPGGSQSRS